MAPRREPAIDTNAHHRSHRSVDNWNTILVTCYSRTLNAIQKSGEANLRLANHSMRAQRAALDALRARDVGLLAIRATVTLIGRRVSLYYFDIRKQGLDRTQYVN